MCGVDEEVESVTVVAGPLGVSGPGPSVGGMLYVTELAQVRVQVEGVTTPAGCPPVPAAGYGVLVVGPVPIAALDSTCREGMGVSASSVWLLPVSPNVTSSSVSFMLPELPSLPGMYCVFVRASGFQNTRQWAGSARYTAQAWVPSIVAVNRDVISNDSVRVRVCHPSTVLGAGCETNGTGSAGVSSPGLCLASLPPALCRPLRVLWSANLGSVPVISAVAAIVATLGPGASNGSQVWVGSADALALGTHACVPEGSLASGQRLLGTLDVLLANGERRTFAAAVGDVGMAVDYSPPRPLGAVVNGREPGFHVAWVRDAGSATCWVPAFADGDTMVGLATVTLLKVVPGVGTALGPTMTVDPTTLPSAVTMHGAGLDPAGAYQWSVAAVNSAGCVSTITSPAFEVDVGPPEVGAPGLVVEQVS